MRMPRNSFMAAALAVLPLAVAQAQKPAEPPQSSPDATFESLDRDGDGRVSREEAAGSKTVLEEFRRMDTNGDGYIDRKEQDQENSQRTPEHD